jgi:hypothetical protein
MSLTQLADALNGQRAGLDKMDNIVEMPGLVWGLKSGNNHTVETSKQEKGHNKENQKGFMFPETCKPHDMITSRYQKPPNIVIEPTRSVCVLCRLSDNILCRMLCYLSRQFITDFHACDTRSLSTFEVTVPRIGQTNYSPSPSELRITLDQF